MSGVRCTQSNKFTSLEGMEIETNLEVEEETLSGTVTVERLCANCGEALKRVELDVEEDLDRHHTCEGEEDSEEECEPCGGDGDIDEECGDCRGTGKCANCSGTGTTEPEEGEPDDSGPECRECGGTGECGGCDGTGEVNETCGDCGGTGRVSKSAYDEDHYSLDEVSTEEHERAETTVQRGKKKGQTITNPRYQSMYYGAVVTASITCHRCQEAFDVVVTVEAPASSFEEA